MVGRAALSFVLVAACRYSLENNPQQPDGAVKMDAAIDAAPSPTCIEAKDHSDLAFIEDKIFARSCTFNGCHNGISSTAGHLDLRAAGSTTPSPPGSHGELVGVDAETDSDASPSGSYKLVVPGKPNESYLLFSIQHVPGAEMDPPAGAPDPKVGFMPQAKSGAFVPLCIEKQEAIRRWIEAGAPPRS